MKLRIAACASLLLVAISLAVRSASPQTEESARQESQDDSFTLKVDVDLVNINVVVADASGGYLTDLSKEKFKLYEDKVEQTITNFSPVDAPFAVALLLDTSQSTRGKLGQIQDAAVRFVQQIHPDDEVMVISFDDEVHLDTDFTRNKRAVERAIKMTRSGMSTQLYEAVYLGLQQKLRKRRDRKAMVLFTDGVDSSSPTSSSGETLKVAREADALIFPIFFDTRMDLRQMSGSPIPPSNNPRFPMPGRIPVDTRSPRQRDQDERQIEMESMRGRHYLSDLADVTGGTLYDAADMDALDRAFEKIAQELRSLYSLGYVSSNRKKDGKFRKITIKVDVPGAIVKTRKGYVAPKM
ncbi:MAG: VWA domain-containing protein [Acidobacteriota bacterium]